MFLRGKVSSCCWLCHRPDLALYGVRSEIVSGGRATLREGVESEAIRETASFDLAARPLCRLCSSDIRMSGFLFPLPNKLQEGTSNKCGGGKVALAARLRSVVHQQRSCRAAALDGSGVDRPHPSQCRRRSFGIGVPWGRALGELPAHTYRRQQIIFLEQNKLEVKATATFWNHNPYDLEISQPEQAFIFLDMADEEYGQVMVKPTTVSGRKRHSLGPPGARSPAPQVATQNRFPERHRHMN